MNKTCSNTLIGLACCRLVVPGALLAVRRLASLTRRLAGQWCGVPIHEAYAPAARLGRRGIARRAA